MKFLQKAGASLWKTFLPVLGTLFVVAIYLGLAVGISFSLQFVFPGGPIGFFLLISLALPMITGMAIYNGRKLYAEAKKEVERENKRMMASIKGDTYD